MENLDRCCKDINLCTKEISIEFPHVKKIFHFDHNHFLFFNNDLEHKTEIDLLYDTMKKGDKVQGIVHVQRIDHTIIIN